MPKKLEEDASFQAYQEILIDPERSGLTNEQIASELNVCEGTIYRWKKRVDWTAIRDERRKRYTAKMLQVDNSMFDAAIKDRDVAAAKYLAERFDGWIPTQGTLDLNRKKDDELTKRANEIAAQLRAGTGVISDSPGIGQA